MTIVLVEGELSCAMMSVDRSCLGWINGGLVQLPQNAWKRHRPGLCYIPLPRCRQMPGLPNRPIARLYLAWRLIERRDESGVEPCLRCLIRPNKCKIGLPQI